MKKVRVWLISILLILLSFVFGCTSLYNGKEDTAVTTLNTTTSSTTSESHSTTQTTVDTTVSNTTSASHTTTGPHGGSVAHKKFKSVEELFDWIHNGKGIANFFRGAIQGLKLDHLLIIEATDDTFTLEYIRTFQRGSGWDAQIEYYFISEKGERVGFIVQLEDMRAFVDDVEIYVDSTNLDNDYSNHFKLTYRDITVKTEDGSTS